MKILLTCPPMISSMDALRHHFAKAGVICDIPEFQQQLTEEELIPLLPQYDGWIAGDDPVNRRVLTAGKQGKLKALIKWGVGVDNVDFEAVKDLDLPFSNTPGMFGAEVADVALAYLIATAKDLVRTDRKVRAGEWPKPVGVSLRNKTVALVGFGDIGRHTARRLLACELKVNVYDPAYQPVSGLEAVRHLQWPDRIEDADFMLIACSLNPENRGMINRAIFSRCKRGLRFINIARGPLVKTEDLVAALQDGTVAAAALDVFEVEPLQASSPLRQFDQCIFGSHNCSNTRDAVIAASEKAIRLLFGFLDIQQPKTN